MKRPNLGSISITKSGIDAPDPVESPLKKKRTTLKQVKTDGDRPDDYMFEKKAGITAADMDKAKKQFDKEVDDLVAKLDDKDKEVTKLKKLSPKALLEKFQKPDVFLKLFATWKAELEPKDEKNEGMNTWKAVQMEFK